MQISPLTSSEVERISASTDDSHGLTQWPTTPAERLCPNAWSRDLENSPTLLTRFRQTPTDQLRSMFGVGSLLNTDVRRPAQAVILGYCLHDGIQTYDRKQLLSRLNHHCNHNKDDPDWSLLCSLMDAIMKANKPESSTATTAALIGLKDTGGNEQSLVDMFDKTAKDVSKSKSKRKVSPISASQLWLNGGPEMTCKKNVETIIKFEREKQDKEDDKANNAATRAAKRAEVERTTLTEVVQWIAWSHSKQAGHLYYPDDSGNALNKQPKPSSATLTRFVRTMVLKFPDVVNDFDVTGYLSMVKTKNQPFNVTERCRLLCSPVARDYMLRHTESNAVQVLRRQAVALITQHATVETTTAANSAATVTSESRTTTTNNNKTYIRTHSLTHTRTQ